VTSRDRRYEAAFLAVAARAHGQAGTGWARHAAVRLEAGEDAYGERWTTLGTEALLDELAEEAADLGAWGALARQALDLEPVDAAILHRVAAALDRAAEAGAAAYAALLDARQALDRDPVTPDSVRFSAPERGTPADGEARDSVRFRAPDGGRA